MTKIRNLMDILLQWSIHVFIKKNSDGAIKNENMSKKKLAQELHKAISKVKESIFAQW